MNNNYDVAILGGGLAGLTLSIQLKRANPDISIIILEKRKGEAATAAHKVGESTVELGTHYLREVLDLKDHLEKHQLPKHGLRFFLSPQHKDDISRRVELGPRERLPVPSHQIDRGTFENFLVEHTKTFGTEVLLNSKAVDATISADGHTVMYTQDGEEKELKAKWIVDATSRGSFLKRKLGFKKSNDHNVNAVWFRLKGEIDIDDWSDNKEWNSYLKPGLRRLGTIHLMDKGYWVWLIPLGSGNTSIGIVADPELHPFEDINRFDKAMDWLEKNEPQCFKMLDPKRDDLMDFKVLKHYSHGSGRFYSSDRWAVTGEAGAFLDPFYSPGTDFIAISNSMICDLIIDDLKGESIELSAKVYEWTYSTFFESWIPIYLNKYPLMGHTQIMTIKIMWDWAVYWAVPTLLFTNGGFTNLRVLRKLTAKPSSVLRKLGVINENMQDFFLQWMPHDNEAFSDQYRDIFDIGFMRDLHRGVEQQFSEEELLLRLETNMVLLEKIAAELFRRVDSLVNGASEDAQINPYTKKLGVETTDTDADGIGELYGPDILISEEIDNFWFYKKATQV